MKQLIKNVSVVLLGLAKVSTVQGSDTCENKCVATQDGGLCAIDGDFIHCSCNNDSHEGDGLQSGVGCTAKHPCLTSSFGGCDASNGRCIQGAGNNYTCKCLDEHEDIYGNGKECRYVGPCDPRGEGYACDGNADCSVGWTTTCTCKTGYEGDGYKSGTGCTAKAANPCDSDPCDPVATCSVWDGQAECECPDTHMGDGLKIGSGCTLLHPCDQPNRGGCMFPATCNRVGAGHTCICPFGYVDYNEDGSYCEWFPCSTISRGYDCVENSRCIDGFGDDGNVNAFVRDCMCKPGYSGDGRVSCTAQPIDGAYGAWGQWGKCSKSCGTGSQTRTRACNNPAPEHGGKDCSSLGNSTETVDCNTSACPIDGGFTEWGSWGACSTTCGAGLKSASRTCTNPAPSNGGADCVGDLTTTASCNLKSCAGVTMECNDDNTLTVNVESEVSGSILSVAYGSCSKDVISGANVTDQTKWSLTLEPSRCDMEGNLRTLKYNQTAEIVVGRQDGAQQLVFNTYKVDSYCQYTAEYTVTYTYSSVSANEYEFTDSGGVLGLNFFIESMNEYFNETTVNSQMAGSTIYLSLKLNSTANDDFDNAASASASSGKLFVPKACSVKDGSNNTFTLFDTDAEQCTNDIIDLRVSAKQFGADGSQQWNFSHTLFLIDDQNSSTYTLSCNVIVCDASRSDDCKRAGDCLDDSYVV